jgi:hypothetical protein
MIKLKAYNEARKTDFFVLGLSEGNLTQLRKGHPIMIHGADWNQPFDLMIFWGETDRKLAEMVKPFIGPETIVKDELTNPPKKN